jgi:hypothetical protein
MSRPVPNGYNYSDSEDGSDSFSDGDPMEDTALPVDGDGGGAWATKKWDAFQVRSIIFFYDKESSVKLFKP